MSSKKSSKTATDRLSEFNLARETKIKGCLELQCILNTFACSFPLIFLPLCRCKTITKCKKMYLKTVYSENMFLVGKRLGALLGIDVQLHVTESGIIRFRF